MQPQFGRGKFNRAILVADSNEIIYGHAFDWVDKEEGDVLTTQTVFYMGLARTSTTSFSI